MHWFKQGPYIFTYSIIVQRYTNVYSNIQQIIFDAYYLVDFLVHVWIESMSVTNVPHGASRKDGHTCIYVYILTFDPLHAPRHAV